MKMALEVHFYDGADDADLPDGHHEDDSKDDRKHCGHQVVHNGPDSNL